MVSRDVKALKDAGLIVRKGNAVRPHFELLLSFLPPLVQPPIEAEASCAD